jgi:hypothetical protein
MPIRLSVAHQVKLTTDFYLVPWLNMNGATPPFFHFPTRLPGLALNQAEERFYIHLKR